MENIVQCCARLDVHKESVEACIRRIEPNGQTHQQTRHCETMTGDILMMADWMAGTRSHPRRYGIHGSFPEADFQYPGKSFHFSCVG